MPGPGSHTYHSAKMEACLKDLEDKGADPGKAHAICYASLGSAANKSAKSSDNDKDCPICSDIHKLLSKNGKLILKNEKSRYTLGVVYEPDTLDTDEEFAKAEDIELAAWDFMRNIQGRGEMAKAAINLLGEICQATQDGDEIRIELDEEVEKQLSIYHSKSLTIREEGGKFVVYTDTGQKVKEFDNQDEAKKFMLAEVHKRGVNGMHVEDLEGSEVVESWIAPVDININGEMVKKGSWMAGIIWDEESFGKIESGEWTGYSMGGWAKKENI